MCSIAKLAAFPALHACLSDLIADFKLLLPIKSCVFPATIKDVLDNSCVIKVGREGCSERRVKKALNTTVDGKEKKIISVDRF